MSTATAPAPAITPEATEEKKGPTGRPFHEVKHDQVQPGHLMAFIYYAKVESVHAGGERLQVVGLTKGAPPRFGVDGKDLVTGALSADQFHETIQVSMTEAANILVESPNTPLTVCFIKKDGTDRILRGRFLAEEPRLGYSWCEDLEKPEGDRVREVNHREIKWLIVRGVRYEVKGKNRKTAKK